MFFFVIRQKLWGMMVKRILVLDVVICVKVFQERKGQKRVKGQYGFGYNREEVVVSQGQIFIDLNNLYYLVGLVKVIVSVIYEEEVESRKEIQLTKEERKYKGKIRKIFLEVFLEVFQF